MAYTSIVLKVYLKDGGIRSIAHVEAVRKGFSQGRKFLKVKRIDKPEIRILLTRIEKAELIIG